MPPRTPPSHPSEITPTHTDLLLSIASSNSVSGFITGDGQAFIEIPLGPHGRQVAPVRSATFRDWLIDSFWTLHQTPPDERAVRHAIRILQAQAFGNNSPLPVHVRVAPTAPLAPGAIALDLGNDAVEVVHITPAGWHIDAETESLFRRGRGYLALPRPIAPDSPALALAGLRPLLNLDDGPGWLRCLAWLLAALRPAGPYPVLVLRGPLGSGKSTAARLLRVLIDPVTAPLWPPPSSARRLPEQVWFRWIAAFDHVSRLPSPLTGALCRLAAGGGYWREDPADEYGPVMIDLRRPILLVLAPGTPLPPELASRALVVDLPALPPERRRTEAGLRRHFEQSWPSFLGALCSAVSTALARLPEIRLQPAPRLADAASWAVAAAPALGIADTEMLAAFPFDARSSDPVIDALAVLLDGSDEWTGSAADLLEKLRPSAGPALPGTPKGLMQHFNQSTGALAEAGLEVTSTRNHEGRAVRVTHRLPKCVTQAPLVEQDQ